MDDPGVSDLAYPTDSSLTELVIGLARIIIKISR